jgi:hypothetical protein
MQGLIIFQYTNAYDIYSADALSMLTCIEETEMNEDGCWIYCDDLYPVVEVMERFGFVYEIIENKL